MLNRFNIQNRRFMGGKYRLLDFIDGAISEHCPDCASLLDIFAGTGVVANHFMARMRVGVNDNLYHNHLSHIAFMSDEAADEKKIADLVDGFNRLEAASLEPNYMSENFGGTYFTDDVCRKIGHIRQSIQNLHDAGELTRREMAILVTSLIYSMDRIANTCGHYDAYRRGGLEKAGPFVMNPLELSRRPVARNMFFNDDANRLAQSGDFGRFDCVYCDPPYNSRNYCDLYHLLENVARWQKPAVKGVARKMDRSALKSRYCGCEAAIAFQQLVNSLDCRLIALSYNNTGKTNVIRSSAAMTDDEIMTILSARGKVTVYSMEYTAFSAGKSFNDSNRERLFVCEVR